MTNSLMTSRRFAPLFWTQFLSAFNDNFLKNTLVFLILFQLGSQASGTLITLAGAIFIAPFLFLSSLGGELADRYDKAVLAEKLKLAEVGAAVVAIVGMGLSSVSVLFAALFLFGVISALFGPIKYGILPDHLEQTELPRANAWIEAATFMAILGGTIVGGLAFARGGSVITFGPMMMILAVGCWLISRYIPKTGSGAPDLKIDRNIFRSTKNLIGDLRSDSRMWRSALMVSWFWLIGALFLSILPVIVKDFLGGHEMAVTFYLSVFAIAVAIGSGVAAWMSAGRVVLLPAPIGTLLMALFCFDLAIAVLGTGATTTATSMSEFLTMDNTVRVAVDMAGLAIAGSFLVVPSYTALQSWAPKQRRARVVAANNALNAGFMALGGGLLAGFQAAGATLSMILAAMAVMNIIAACFMLKYLPTNAFRDFVSIFFRAFHRLEIEGMENIEKAGTAPILALNHVSFLDGALALTLTDDEPTFAIDAAVAERWWVKPFLRVCNALPLNPAKPMATRTLINVVQGGAPLVIFPEGRITVTGGLMKVYDGAAMVADKTGSNILPIRIEGLERSFMSRLGPEHGRRSLFPKVKVKILPPQKLKIDEALKGSDRRSAAGAELYKIMSNVVFETSLDDNKTIPERLIDTARYRGMGKLAVEDPLTGRLSYGKLLLGANILARKFKRLFEGQSRVGVMLPNANGVVATILGLMSAGKVPAMLNFTAGPASLVSACRTAGLKTVLTSKAFVEQGKLEPLIEAMSREVDIIWMDDVRKTIGLMDKLLGLAGRTTLRSKRSYDDEAVVLFTSGSEGTPKGVVLTHRNILANAAQAAARIDFTPNDKVFNVLPVFHSFGLTAGTVLPLISGVPVYFYPTPLHYRIIPELVYASNATIIFGTDTFLSGYARTAHAYDFRSVRYCFAGAEPVKPSTRVTFMNRFGLRILEGYGVTETAPVISINTPMFNKPNTVGKLMPGMETRLESVPGIDEGGRLFVKGPNVMAGYLKADDPGVLQPLKDGWHDTGDIVIIDEDGFIAICGRAKRFAKIGGEMVSLAAIEAHAGELWPGSLSAATAVKDARKGEKLIVVTDREGATRGEFLAHIKAKGAQDLMVPAEVRFIKDVPVLGTGKVDFVSVSKMVQCHQETV